MRVEGDILFLKWVGDFQLADMLELHIVAEQMFTEYEICYLFADATAARSVTREARRCAAEWSFSERVGGTVVFGAGLAARTAATIVSAVVKVCFPKAAIPLEFTRTEDAARAWLHVRRREIESGMPGRRPGGR